MFRGPFVFFSFLQQGIQGCCGFEESSAGLEGSLPLVTISNPDIIVSSSILVKYLAPFSLSNNSEIKGEGYMFLIVPAFSFW